MADKFTDVSDPGNPHVHEWDDKKGRQVLTERDGGDESHVWRVYDISDPKVCKFLHNVELPEIDDNGEKKRLAPSPDSLMGEIERKEKEKGGK